MNLLQNPNKRRWYIVATIFVAIICNYLDRQLLSILKPEILTHFGIEDLQYAWIVNVFLICYAIMYPISGILVDRFGSKKVMLGGIVAWSLACIGGGLSTNVVEFTICRGILGLAEPTIFAGQIVAVTLWFEKRHRATANSLCTAGGSLGTVIAPLVIAWMARFLPWHDVFIVAGLVGLVIAVAWALIYKNPPQEVLAVTMAPDKDEVARNNGEQQRAFTWGELWTTRSLWGVLLIRLISDPVWYFCCFWLPGYLRSMGEVQGLSQQATLDMIQYIGGLPFLFGAVGGILTSVWSDWLVRRGMPALKARKTMMIIMAFVAPLCILTPYVSEWQAVSFDARIGLVVAIFSLIAIMCLSWLYTICVVIAEAFPVKNVASVVGITAGAGAVGGAVFNIFIGSLLATMGNVLFAVMGVMHLVTAVILGRKGNQIIKGLPQLFIDRLRARGAAGEHRPCKLHVSLTIIDPEEAKTVALEMLQEVGVEVLMYVFCVDVVKNGDAVEGVVVESKAGREAILAKTVIDCTGDGDVACRAGVECRKGDADGGMQPPTLMFCMKGVDVQKLRDALVGRPDVFDMDTMPAEQFRTGKFITVGLRNQIRKAEEAGYKIPVARTILITGIKDDEIWVNMSRVSGVDATKPESYTHGEVEGRKQIYELERYLKNFVPGFENAWREKVAPFMGIRESRVIVGKYILTAEDILACRRFDDAVAVASYPVDIHHATGGDCTLHWCEDCYDIPYRSLVPAAVENLLVAGRCSSMNHEAMASTRVMSTCMALGEAAGRAARIALEEGVRPSAVDVEKVREELRQTGAYLR